MSLRVLKSWWRDESFIQPWRSTSTESTSWWRMEFRNWRREGRAKDQPPSVPQHLQGETVTPSLCNNKCSGHGFMKESVPSKVNERENEVYFLLQIFFALYVDVILYIIHVFQRAFEHRMRWRLKLLLTWWSSASIYFAFETYFYMYW